MRRGGGGIVPRKLWKRFLAGKISPNTLSTRNMQPKMGERREGSTHLSGSAMAKQTPNRPWLPKTTPTNFAPKAHFVQFFSLFRPFCTNTFQTWFQAPVLPPSSTPLISKHRRHDDSVVPFFIFLSAPTKRSGYVFSSHNRPMQRAQHKSKRESQRNAHFSLPQNPENLQTTSNDCIQNENIRTKPAAFFSRQIDGSAVETCGDKTTSSVIWKYNSSLKPQISILKHISRWSVFVFAPGWCWFLKTLWERKLFELTKIQLNTNLFTFWSLWQEKERSMFGQNPTKHRPVHLFGCTTQKWGQLQPALPHAVLVSACLWFRVLKRIDIDPRPNEKWVHSGVYPVCLSIHPSVCLSRRTNTCSGCDSICGSGSG